MIITYLFWLRGRLDATQAQAEAAQRLAGETQLKLMKNQLEPHMLFNTLANLRALIGVDPAQAQAMLDRLIDFLRDYLALMQLGMGDRLHTALELPPDAMARPPPAPASAPSRYASACWPAR